MRTLKTLDFKKTKTLKKRSGFNLPKGGKSIDLTKRVLQSALIKGTRNLTSKAMDIKGYVITIQDGWLIKKDKDGSSEKLSKIKQVKLSEVNFD